MKVYKTNEISNLAIVGGSGAGKTTLTESMLLEGGIIRRRGSVNAKNTVSDCYPVEQEYGYSVFSTVFAIERGGHKLNMFDCPGSGDFSGGAVTALNICDIAMLVVNGAYGVEVGTQNNFRQAAKLHKPIVFVVNNIDSDKCDYDKVVEDLKRDFGGKVIPAQFPATCGPDFNSVIDVLTMKQYTYTADGTPAAVSDIPAALADKAQEMHDALVEAAAGGDEALMEKFFETMELTEDEMVEGIKKGLSQHGIYPVLCSSASKNVGVARILDFVAGVAPTVDEFPGTPNTKGEEVKCDASAPTSLFFFKTEMEQHIGEVCYFKVMSGTVKTGDDLNNATRGSKERIAQLFTPGRGNYRQLVDELQAGDLGCTVKLKDVKTGNTLNSKDADNLFDFIVYPNFKYSRAIRPENEADTEKMMTAANRLHEQDPTWVIEQSKELRQIIIHGQGEFHLRTLKWLLENNDKLSIIYDEPRIPYRETITKAARADYRHKKQSGGSGQFGEVHLIVEPYREGMPEPDTYKFGNQEYKMNIKDKQEIPMEWGGMLVVYNCIVGGAIDARFIPAIVKGIMDRMEQGPLTGSYARDVRVCIYDGKMHPVDSNEISFRLAARNAFSTAFRDANPKVLEPVYDVEILLPGDCMGGVQSDLQGRRGIMMDMSSANGMERVKARIPLKEMSNYSTALSSISGGRASFNMKFSSYELVPADVQAQLLKEYEESKQDED
ncbi:MAG: elongation factor G [Bacteroidaceae bacterium]|nr:elongation factor G [Bacteroidaceae bacterium]